MFVKNIITSKNIMGFLTKVATAVEKDPMPAAATISASLGVVLGIVVSKLVNKCDCSEGMIPARGGMSPGGGGGGGGGSGASSLTDDDVKKEVDKAKNNNAQAKGEIIKARESLKNKQYTNAENQANTVLRYIANVGDAAFRINTGNTAQSNKDTINAYVGVAGGLQPIKLEAQVINAKISQIYKNYETAKKLANVVIDSVKKSNNEIPSPKNLTELKNHANDAIELINIISVLEGLERAAAAEKAAAEKAAAAADAEKAAAAADAEKAAAAADAEKAPSEKAPSEKADAEKTDAEKTDAATNVSSPDDATVALYRSRLRTARFKPSWQRKLRSLFRR